MSEDENENEMIEKEDKQVCAREMIDMMFSSWLMSAFQPLFYALTHAFEHYKREGVYDHENIAAMLQKLAKEDFVKASIDLEEFRSDLFDKLLKKIDK